MSNINKSGSRLQLFPSNRLGGGKAAILPDEFVIKAQLDAVESGASSFTDLETVTMTASGLSTLTGGASFGTANTYKGITTITAFATGGQASATQITGEENNVTVCATAGDSVKLGTSALGSWCIIKNNGAAALDIFPATGATINALAANLAIRIQPKSTATFIGISATAWQSIAGDASITLNSPSTGKGQLEILAADSAGNTVTTITNASQAAARTYTIPDAGTSASFVMNAGASNIGGIKTFTSATVFSATNTYFGVTSITASATQTQAAGTAITGELNYVTTVATAGDAVTLAVPALGSKQIVKNTAAKACQVFPVAGVSATIDGAAANASFLLGPGQEVTFEGQSATVYLSKEGTSVGTISAVTQGTSITTGVTVNSIKGIITTFTPSTAGLAATTFTVTNNKTTATSNIRAWVTEYGGTVITNGLPYVFVKNQTATGFDVIVYNAHATNALATSLKIGFEIIN